MTEFREQDLTGARFERVILRGASFKKVLLNEASMHAVDLTGAQFRCNVVVAPARVALVGELVDRDHIEVASSMGTAAMAVGRAAGPPCPRDGLGRGRRATTRRHPPLS